MISLYGDPKPFCDTCHGSREIHISESVTVTAFHCIVMNISNSPGGPCRSRSPPVWTTRSESRTLSGSGSPHRAATVSAESVEI